MNPILNIVLLLVTGLCAGVLSGMFGVGGGVILVPILVYVFGYAQTAATGTSLVALLLPVGILGVRHYYLSGRINQDHIKTGLILALGLFIGAFFGSKIATQLPDQVLRKSFAVFLIFIAARLWWL
jgi:uncharacterized membrane protein YfcA